MRIIQIAAETAPIAKVGGMGDVIPGLSYELTQEGHDVEIILPKYQFIDKKIFSSFRLSGQTILCKEGRKKYKNRIYHCRLQGLKITLIDPEKDYFHRPNIYGYKDDTARFCYFAKAALEYLLARGRPIDVLHMHDWHTAVIAPLYRNMFDDRGLRIKGLMLTIHNLAYQGIAATWDLDRLGLKGKSYLKDHLLQDGTNPRDINLLKGAINLCDAVTVVSPTYSKEILEKKNSCGLKKTLLRNHYKLTGIINGLDSLFWDPKKDLNLAINYSNDSSISAILEAKAACKRLLFPDKSKSPLIGCISRLVPQKGPKLIKSAIIHSLKKKAQFALLGSSPIKSIEDEFAQLKKHLENNPNAILNFEFNDHFSHLLYGACDFIIVPSYFEPCGLTQMIAMRYGAIPIVRKTGGLADTVFDIDDPAVPNSKKNGFVFSQYTAQGINKALDRAINIYTRHPSKYKKMVKTAMLQDFSWKASTQKYVEQYQKIIRQKP